MEMKRHWLGQQWYLPGNAGNEINKVSTCSLVAVDDPAEPVPHLDQCARQPSEVPARDAARGIRHDRSDEGQIGGASRVYGSDPQPSRRARVGRVD